MIFAFPDDAQELFAFRHELPATRALRDLLPPVGSLAAAEACQADLRAELAARRKSASGTSNREVRWGRAHGRVGNPYVGV